MPAERGGPASHPPKEIWDERVHLLLPYQINRGAMERTGNPNAKVMHCLPAYHDKNTVVGREIMEHVGLEDELEVTNEVFESRRASCSTRRRTAST